MDTIRIASELRAAKGAVTFIAVTEDGERPMNAPRTKGRWEKLARLAGSLEAMRVECRAADGAVLAVVVVDDEPRETASVPRAAMPDAGKLGEVGALVSLIMQASDAQIARFQSMTETFMKASATMVESVARRVDSLETRHEETLRLRERALVTDSESLSEMAGQIQAERAAVEQAITAMEVKADAVVDENGKMVERLLEPVLQGVVAKLAAGMAG